jgi:sugar phosphate isomerase/epimerase
MKLAVTTLAPDIAAQVPVALLAGDFAARLGRAAALGYDGVELMSVRPERLDAAAIREQAAALGLEIAAVASGAIALVEQLTLLAADRETSRRAMERLRDLIGLAALLGAPVVTIGSFRGRLAAAGGAPARGLLVQMLRAAADHAGERGVRLALEPLNRYESDIVNNAAEGLALIEEVGQPCLGLLLDTFHVNIEEPSLDGGFRQVMAAGRLWHVHLGDSNRLAPGQGHLDFAAIVAALRAIGYNGYLSAELLARPDPDTAAVATIEYMRRLVS